jgi:hypothetical protein
LLICRVLILLSSVPVRDAHVVVQINCRVAIASAILIDRNTHAHLHAISMTWHPCVQYE